MKCYLIDEITVPDMEKIEMFLREKAAMSGMENLFWMEMPGDRLNWLQAQHLECQPYKFAIELGKDWIKVEFLLRGSRDLICPCSGYCDPGQRDFILDYMDNMLGELNIGT
jgi:hypothetical protein